MSLIISSSSIFLTSPSVCNHAHQFDLGGVFLVDGQMYVHIDVEWKKKCSDILKSLRDFVPCYVREIFAFEGILTFAIFRLNNRDTLRDRPPKNNSTSAFRIASVRPNEASYKSKTGQTAVTFAVNQTVASDFAPSTPDSDNELGLDKSVRVFLSIAALCY